MRTQTHYEWIIEHVDEHDDIQDIEHFDRFADARHAAHREPRAAGIVRADLALTANIGNDEEGLIERLYAYLVDGVLPERFETVWNKPDRAVPQRFHNEVKKVVDRVSNR